MTRPFPRFLGFCARRPKTCIVVLHFALVGLTLLRLRCSYPSLEQIILYNGWDDGKTFFDIAARGYRALPSYEYRELFGYPLAARLFFLFLGPSPYALALVSFLSSLLANLVILAILRSWNLSAGEALGGTVFFMTCRTPESIMSIFGGWPLPPMEHLVAIEGSEPLFLLLVLLAYLPMERGKHLSSALLLAAATLVRPHGSFIAFGAFIYLFLKKDWKALFYCLSPMVVALHFAYYYWIRGDFFAFCVAAREYYPDGVVFAYPFRDLVRNLHALSVGALPVGLVVSRVVFQVFFLYGFVLLFRRKRLLFWLMLPHYLVNVSMCDWSHHVRYYVVLWGISVVWYLTILDGFRAAVRTGDRRVGQPQLCRRESSDNGQS